MLIAGRGKRQPDRTDQGDPEGYLNRGYTCYKGRVSADRLNHLDRLKYPLKRAGKRGEGKWLHISWQEALEETAADLLEIKEKYGARAVGFGVGMPKGLEHFALIRLARVFGSPNIVASQDVCHAPREITGLHNWAFIIKPPSIPDWRPIRSIDYTP